MKTVVITGATSGIGLAIAKALAKQGDRVIGIGRTEQNCIQAKSRLETEIPDADIVYFHGDLSEQSELNEVADDVISYLEKYADGKLDVLINNAGGVRNWYTTTHEGYELQFALNYLAGFLLTYRLMPHLRESGDGRVLITGSGSHKHTRIRWNDIMFKKHYNCLLAYKQSKLCNLLFACEFNRRFEQQNVRSYVVDPGLVKTDIGNKQTSGIVSSFWSLRKKYGVDPDAAAETYVFLRNQILPPEGLYYYQNHEYPYSKKADDRFDAKKLFVLSEKLCAIDFGGGSAI